MWSVVKENFDKNFSHVENNSYDYEKALKRQNLTQESVDMLRESSKRSPVVPRFIHDKQVGILSENGSETNGIFIQSFSCSSTLARTISKKAQNGFTSSIK
jgi:hypothetical protein